MPKFRFAVRSNEGKLRTGSVTEATIEAAKQRLKGAGFVIVTLAEEVELVIHQPRAPIAGTPRPKLERASIIEFETSLAERAGDFLGRYVLRKEFAVLLFLAGASLAGYAYVTRPKPPPSTELKYLPLSVEIEVRPGQLKGESYTAVLPDIPLQFKQKSSDGDLLKYSFEAVKQPGRVEVRLTGSDNELVAEGEALLSLKKEGLLSGSVELSAPKKTPLVKKRR